jgi:hypothetical protein
MEENNMEKYIVWYKTRSGNYSREILFKSLEKAKSLFNALERDFKYLIGVDENGIHHTLASAEK